MVELTPELRAMVAVEGALKELTDDERRRVVQWLVARYRSAPMHGLTWHATIADRSSNVPDLSAYDELASFYDVARPSTEAESALVATFWFQFKESAEDVDAQRVNTELKHLGRGIGNITRAFESLKAQRPALIVQTRKEGSSKQARKRYKVTFEGRRAVERMLTRGAE